MSAHGVRRLWLWAYVLIIACFMLITYVYYLRSALVDCLNAQSLADQKRTAAIAAVTDEERAADLALIRGPWTPALRDAAIAARKRTDDVRAAWPAPAARSCR